jgi:hypothetical protein
MKKSTLILAAAALALAAPLASHAANHEHMDMGHGEHSMMDMGNTAHQEVIDGVKATFTVLDYKGKMKEMGMKETHHIMVMFKDAKSGKALIVGEVKVKVMSPDKSEQTRDLMGMGNGFGADFTLPVKGKYGVMCKFILKDGKVRSSKFWYTVK